MLVLAATLKAFGVDLHEARNKFLTGDYTGCISAARQALKEDENNPDWTLLLCDSLMTTGQYPEAQTVIKTALGPYRQNIRLFWEARQVFLANGDVQGARQMLENIGRTVFRHPSDFSDADELVISGKTLLLMGVDPKKVLDHVFEAALKSDPKLRDVYLAGGELALDKHDFALAAEKFEAGLAQVPDDPDLQFGLARAYAPNNAALMMSSLESTLERNSNHVGALLMLVDHTIDAEDYPQAAKLLDRVEAINPWNPDAWAYRAAMAELRNEPESAQKAREKGLKYWPNNPRVDYLIGLKWSQNYRFQEGAAHQRGALAFDPAYLPAKAQLAQDLLRLGEEAEGWKLAEEVQKQDAYDVEAYNLTTLHDTMGKFTTLTNQDFMVRMNSTEAALYGQSVLNLLEQARSNLCAKYGFETSRPTIVEVFHE
ncbi:MAG TPA: tetratricopeptide repeat protein, partial [Verrucomicrobiae bacterium]|nr:tetratricopeptide repeat protein [Verrucomicrobiae bacterium]